jgi:hypothetical protein
MTKKIKGPMNNIAKIINIFLQKIHSNVLMLNGSKIFAGFMIIVLNISSRFVTIKLSKSMESYLKYTFSRQILIFAIAWMGTRDIYISLAVAVGFTLIMDILLNEESQFCVLPSSFTDYHAHLSETEPDNNDITRNIPGMPQPASSKKTEGLCDKSKKDNTQNSTDEVNEEDIKQALLVLKRAKEQNTVNTKDEFYQTSTNNVFGV